MSLTNGEEAERHVTLGTRLKGAMENSCLVRAHVEWGGRAVMRKSEAKKIELTPALMTAPEQIGLFGWH